MISLTFGEQVKIVLSRKGMTIKELAEQIEMKTGKKMSRQNLTQRLGRDNFQEQDMRMIAEILGCSFQLSILATQEAAERASVIEEVLPTTGEIGRLEARKERKAARAEAKRKELEERDLTVGEIVDLLRSTAEAVENEASGAEEHVEGMTEMQGESETIAETEAVSAKEENSNEMAKNSGAEIEEETLAELPVSEEIVEETTGNENTAAAEAGEMAAGEEMQEAASQIEPEYEGTKAMPEEAAVEAPTEEEEAADSHAQEQIEQPKPEEAAPTGTKAPEKKGGFWSRWEKPKKKEEHSDFQPIRQRVDEDEDREKGDVNPYTGREYQSNSVRMHPKRIGYVQVYDRKEHKWTDMTEWAFLGFEERKKAAMGKDYEPPIYLD
ncbi:hypothetical protein ABXS75_04620 [Roseburia hominis]